MYIDPKIIYLMCMIHNILYVCGHELHDNCISLYGQSITTAI